jgi:S-adenosylmethionine decarboxylase
LVDASGCRPEALRDPRALAGIFEALIVTLKLKVVGAPQWHTFPGPGGITGLALLSESHLGIHTFPEHGFAALSVYSCRTREAPDFEALIKAALGATLVTIRTVPREVMR